MTEQTERRDALRALLLHPLLTQERHGDDLLLVRRHADHLQRLCAESLGYRLVVEPHAARLHKAGLGRDGSRGLVKKNGRPFEPRAYALLCLTLAALSRCPSQLLLDELVAQVRSAVADAGLGIDLETVADRRALAAVLGVLMEHGVLVERDGDLSRYAEDGEALALLDVRRERLRLLSPTGLAGAARPTDLLDAAATPSAAGGSRVFVRRALVESPVLTEADLTADQQQWWSRSRTREVDWLHDHVGLDLELRAEGALAVDPDETLSDLAFPGTGSLRHAALLTLARLADGVREAARGSGQAWWPLPPAALEQAVADVAAEHGRGLRRAYADTDLLARDVVELLTGVGLLRPGLIHAAAARYAPVTSYAEGLF